MPALNAGALPTLRTQAPSTQPHLPDVRRSVAYDAYDAHSCGRKQRGTWHLRGCGPPGQRTAALSQRRLDLIHEVGRLGTQTNDRDAKNDTVLDCNLVLP